MTAWRVEAPLDRPYDLAFGTLYAFTLLFVRLTDSSGAGWGEIAPLPGYGGETAEQSAAALQAAADALAAGGDIEPVAHALSGQAPMTASALVCAGETLALGPSMAFEAGRAAPLSLVGLCGGTTPETAAEAARRLYASGYGVLKLKIGGAPVSDDLARIRAVASVAPVGTRIRIDANQSLGSEAAQDIGSALAGLPVEFFEQPFAPECWVEHAALAERLPVPLMLDESVWSEDDVAHAAAAGAGAVKLKLCKHPGLAATKQMAAAARRFGLSVILGNGVQSALGNHLEAGLALDLALDCAAECNGFSKLATSPFDHRLSIDGGALQDGGIAIDVTAPVGAALVLDKVFTK